MDLHDLNSVFDQESTTTKIPDILVQALTIVSIEWTIAKWKVTEVLKWRKAWIIAHQGS